jgi:hypothetical protein
MLQDSLAIGSTWTDGSDFYPGTMGCEATCEGNDIEEHTCAAIGSFCKWDDGNCWSAVGGNPCPMAEAEADTPEQMARMNLKNSLLKGESKSTWAPKSKPAMLGASENTWSPNMADNALTCDSAGNCMLKDQLSYASVVGNRFNKL